MEPIAKRMQKRPLLSAVVGWLKQITGPLIGLLLLCLVLSLMTDSFLTKNNLLNVMDQVTVLGVMAIGMTFVILIGGIDLSVGALLAVSTMVMGALNAYAGVPLPIAMLAGVMAAAIGGFANGVLVVQLGVPSFVATLAMMSIARGVANITTDGTQITGYSAWFSELSIIRYGGLLSATVAFFIFLALVCGVLLSYHTMGRKIYAIGGGSEVARLAGIRARAYTMWIYVFCGVTAGFGGVLLATRLDSSDPSAGLGWELDTIAAVVIGGASLSGGVGSIGGTVIGVLIIGVLRNGLNLIGISPFIQQIVIGLVIAFAVILDQLRLRRG
ncbi:Ribose import permease protein RbsC [Roseibaca ekhonensis]|uniref:Ribose import permease protein RbsC n=1 Tax=Roseinatronobacter ekhonensis TaxID=254356 RepID=A0A3B0MS86_9RHOB|nr:ABC transporter permease [Roseibaca ekhonensis]SUZ33897.1 Ribose import permease protein RbsC [Roseibaca ekhonensis]